MGNSLGDRSLARANRILGVILLLLALSCFIEGIRVWDGMGGNGFMQDEYKRYLPLAIKMGMRK